MPMNTKGFPKTTNAAKKATGSMRKAFGWKPDDVDELPAIGHTKVDDDEGGGFASRMTKSIKKRTSR